MIIKNSMFMGVLFLISSFALAGMPTIENFVGEPKVTLIEGAKPVKLAKSATVQESFTVRTASEQLLKMSFGQHFQIIIFPESSLRVEGFLESPVFFKIRRIEFGDGRFYIKNGSSDVNELSLSYESPLFLWKANDKNPYREFFVDLSVATASVKFCAGEQGLRATIFEHETVKTLKYQEGAQFQGLIEEGKIAFDVLLEGRKAPKGQWKEDFTCDFKQILSQMTSLEKQQAIQRSAAEKKRQAILKKKKQDYDASLCHEPNGQFNQCLWKLEQKKCVRYRCDGQGNWSDRQELSKSKMYQCETAAKVAHCDY